MAMNAETDVRGHVLPIIQAPMLILHRSEDILIQSAKADTSVST